MISNLARKIQDFLLDTLFPASCLECGQGEDWLCPKCLKRIEAVSIQVCPYCEKNATAAGTICASCKASLRLKKSPSLDSLLVAARYADVMKLIHVFKYNFVSDIGIILGKLLAESYIKSGQSLPDIIIPIPLHPRRKRWRGFNQAEVLANYMSKNIAPGFQMEMDPDLIRRVRFTRAQMGVKNFTDRRKNISGAFFIPPAAGSKIKGKNILLVDDVATTGSTLLECSRILKKTGAKKVTSIVIARQEFSSTKKP